MELFGLALGSWLGELVVYLPPDSPRKGPREKHGACELPPTAAAGCNRFD